MADPADGDPLIDAASAVVQHACSRLSECFVKPRTADIGEITTRSRHVSECVKMWITLDKESKHFGTPDLVARNYFDYIAPLKHREIPKLPESHITSACLRELIDDPTLEYVDTWIERAFVVNEFGVLRKDVPSDRLFIEFRIPAIAM